jgi:MFS family permease
MLATVFVTRMSMGVQFQSVAAVAPLLVADLGIGYAQLGILSGLYLLPGAAAALPGGVLGARYGERRVVVSSLALMAVGVGVTAASQGFLVAAAGRLAAGIGAVLMNILLAKMVADWFAGRELSTAMAVMLSSWPIGLALASASLGGLAAGTSWRTAIWLTAAWAIAGLVLMLLAYRDPPAASAVPAAGRARLSGRDLALGVSAGFAWGCFNASLVVMVLFGQDLLVTRGVELGTAGATMSALLAITLVSVPVGGVIADRWRHPTLLIASSTLVAGTIAMLFVVSPWPLPTLLVTGFIGGLPAGAIMALVPKAVRAGTLATAFGVYYTVFYLVMALAQAAAGAVRDVSGSAAIAVVFAGALMMTTVVGLAGFRGIERRWSADGG